MNPPGRTYISVSLLLIAAVAAALDGLALGGLATLASVGMGGRLSIVPAWIGLTGAILATMAIGTSVLGRARLGVAAAAMALGVAAALATAERGGDVALLVARLYGGAIAGSLVLWRGLGLASTVPSWRRMATAALLALISVLAAALDPATRPDLVPVALAAGALAGVGLAATRGTEELLLVPAGRRSVPRQRAVALSALLVGAGAVAVAVTMPALRELLALAGTWLEPLLQTLLLLVVTPFVYLADWLVRAIAPVFNTFQIRVPATPPGFDPEAEYEAARQLSLQAVAFLRGLTIAVATLAILGFVLAVIFRGRQVLPPGAELERERIGGASLAGLLRRLVAARQEPRRAPRPGGSGAAARVRRAYWDMLALAERTGAAWRAGAETPREHWAGLPDPPWGEARVLVDAFERARYGGRAEETDAIAAEGALSRVEAALVQRA